MVCDECGAHNTEDLTPGQLCPLCGRGRLYPLEPRTRRPVQGPEREPSCKTAEED